jgi:hypothetical protein
MIIRVTNTKSSNKIYSTYICINTYLWKIYFYEIKFRLSSIHLVTGTTRVLFYFNP